MNSYFILFTPFFIYFLLKASRWVLQACHMNGDFGFFVLKPDQIPTFNPLLIILTIPVFEGFIFPILAK
jgi:hypothetical protein